MASTQREPRYGFHTYEVKVSKEVSSKGTLYLVADSITVSPSGTLMLAVEVEAAEEISDPDDSDATPGSMELPPTTIIAPGHWYSVRMVDQELRPMFVSGDTQE